MEQLLFQRIWDVVNHVFQVSDMCAALSALESIQKHFKTSSVEEVMDFIHDNDSSSE